MKTTSLKQVFQIKVTLDDIRPPIWRRILVPGNVTLEKLHDILQVVMGWDDYHLHQFTISDQYYGIPDDEFGFDVKSEKRCRLNQLFSKPGVRFKYEYDFGDSWGHSLLIEEILPAEKGKSYPVCLKGKRACPPEDVGGSWSYANFLDALVDPSHPEHGEYLEWVGGEFDPEEFDLEAVNESLKKLGKRKVAHRLDEGELNELDEDLPQAASLAKWITQLTQEEITSLENLSLRKDAMAMLAYLRDNKVVGTQATGNFPLKAIKEIVAQFVVPPRVDEEIGGQIFRIRSESDIWPLIFLHTISFFGEMIDGGPSRRWKLTWQGDLFLSLPAPVQVMVLLLAWWNIVDWLIAFPYEGIGSELPQGFQAASLKELLALKIGESVDFEVFADRLIQVGKLTWHSAIQDRTQISLRAAVRRMVIDPMQVFGVVEVDYSINDRMKKLNSFRLTSQGRGMLEFLSTFIAEGEQ
jgi:hypothetical protein